MAEQQNENEHGERSSLDPNWREAERTDYFNTAGEEDTTIWDNMVNAFKPDLTHRRKS
ncbi:MAG TPA: hypothetical protein VFV52_10815 [Bacilli bacterium]|nr:hypothetical protein [Bacilli bacterium]